MKVLMVETSNIVRAVPVITEKYNEVPLNNLKKLMPGRVEPLYINRISRLAFLYLMYVQRTSAERPVNNLATLLMNDPEKVIRGDVVITRTNHLGAGAKILILEDDEIKRIVDFMSRISGIRIEVTN